MERLDLNTQRNQSLAVKLLIFTLSIFLSLQGWSIQSVKSMRVYLVFEPQKTDLKMKLYKLPIERDPDSGDIEISSLSEVLPNMPPIEHGFELKKGAIQPFLMVVENNSNAPKYFFAVSHTILPEASGIGFKLG